MLIHKAIKKSVLAYFMLCGLLCVSGTIQAAFAERCDAQESYDYSLQNYFNKVGSISQEGYLDIEEMPTELAHILKAIPTTHTQFHAHLPQLLAMVTYDPSPKSYSKYLFSSNGLLPSIEAQQKAHNLNYHHIKAPAGPVIWQVLSFLNQRPYLEIKALRLPKNTSLCLQCYHMAMHLFGEKLPVHKAGCQGESFPTTAAPASATACFYSDRFTDQQQRLVIGQIGDKAFPDPNKTITTRPIHSNDHHSLSNQQFKQDSPLFRSASAIGDQHSHNPNNTPDQSFVHVMNNNDEFDSKEEEKDTPSSRSDQQLAPEVLQFYRTLSERELAYNRNPYAIEEQPVGLQTRANFVLPLPKKTQPDQKAIQQWLSAAKNGNFALLENLYKKYNIETNRRNTALQWSAKYGNLNCVKYLLKQGADIHASDKNRNTVLILSSRYGHIGCVEYLVEQGADIQASNQDRDNALTWSAYNGHLYIVEYLVKQGADITWQGYDNKTALECALEQKKYDVADYLKQYEAKLSNWFEAAQSGNKKLLQKLYMTYNTHVNTSNQYKDTALILSAQEGHVACVQFLVEQGAHITWKGKEGKTSLQWATEKKQQNVVDYLVRQQWFKAAKTGNKKLLEQLYHTYHINVNISNDRDTALLLSAQGGHLDIVKYLVNKGADIHTSDKNSNTALILSALMGHLDCLRYLVEQGANIHAKNGMGDTALILSACNGYLDCVKYLVAQGAHVTWKGEENKTALQWAEEKGKQDIVDYLVLQQWFKTAETGNSKSLTKLYNDYNIDVNAKNKHGQTALLLSAKHKKLDMVRYLVEQGSNINASDKNENTALILCPFNGHLRCVQYLVQQGADITWKTKGKTALQWAEEQGKKKVATYLSAADKARTQWFAAAQAGESKSLASLYNEHNINVNTRDDSGNTALIRSSYQGYLDCVKFLVEQSADIHAKSRNNCTSLLVSAANGHLEVVMYLVNQGAKIDNKHEKEGYTALMLSAANGHKTCVKYLVEQGANIHDKDQNNNTALALAIEKDKKDVIRYLSAEIEDQQQWFTAAQSGDSELLAALYKPYYLNAKNETGYTALSFSAVYGHLQCVQYLVKQGANVHASDNNENTPLIWSAYAGHLACVAYLVQQGADITCKGDQQGTAIEWAKQQNKADVVCFLQHPLVTQRHYFAKHRNEREKIYAELRKKVNYADWGKRDPNRKKLSKKELADKWFTAARKANYHEMAYMKCDGQIGGGKFLVTLQDNNPENLAYKGFTALHYAVLHEHLPLVKDLLDTIYNFEDTLNHLDAQGRTAMDIAYMKQNVLILNTLQRAKAVLKCYKDDSNFSQLKQGIKTLMTISQAPHNTSINNYDNELQ